MACQAERIGTEQERFIAAQRNSGDAPDGLAGHKNMLHIGNQDGPVPGPIFIVSDSFPARLRRR